MEGFSGVFLQLKDPRTGNARRHDLCEVLAIALCSCLCGGTTCTEMAEFAEDKVNWTLFVGPREVGFKV